MQTDTAHEMAFWKAFVKTPRFTEDWCSNRKTGELNAFIYEIIRQENPALTLDVGSGAASILHGTVGEYKAYDLLGEKYRQIFDYSRFPDVKVPEAIAGEAITETEVYDVVHMSNALDHTTDPMMTFNNLLRATKTGGLLIIQGFEDEAIHENWKGMHQWNMSLDGGNLVIEGKHRTMMYVPQDSDIMKSETTWQGKVWIMAVIRKTENHQPMIEI